MRISIRSFFSSQTRIANDQMKIIFMSLSNPNTRQPLWTLLCTWLLVENHDILSKAHHFPTVSWAKSNLIR